MPSTECDPFSHDAPKNEAMKSDAHATTTTRQEQEAAGRRGFLAVAVGLGVSALGLCGALWTAVTGRFLMPNALAAPPSRLKVGFPGDYPPGHVETRFRETHGVWVVHGTYRGRRQVFALRTVCTHLGCIVIWQESQRRFKCPCHGSAFDTAGVNYEGPAPRPLERYAISLAADGQLEVDTSVTFQEELGQWNDPRCYVET